MKINSILFFSAIFLLIACNDDTPDGTSGDNSNQNANPTVIQNARNLEMPRLDDQTGDIYSHYVTYRGEQVLNYTLDWHKETLAMGCFRLYQHDVRNKLESQ